MAGSLLQIRKKIKAVHNTRKITKAMKLVAASKMRVFQKKAVNSRLYAWDLLGLMRNLFSESVDMPLLEQREKGKVVFILYTSDKGLCGALNGRIIKALFHSELWLKTPEDDRLLITIGKKSHDYAKYNGIPVAKTFQGINERLTVLDAMEFIDTILDYWYNHPVKQVVMVAPHYKNSLVFYPIVKTFLPFSQEMVTEHVHAEQLQEEARDLNVQMNDDSYLGEEGTEHEPDLIFEPGRERFTEVIIEQIIHTLFIQSFFELKAAEYSSRMIAMQNATEAATDLIDRLTLRFNKARQAAITQEIAELVGGTMT